MVKFIEHFVRTRVAWAAIAILSTMSAKPASAHVKWFADYDVTARPTPMVDLLTPAFGLVLLGTMVLIALIYATDHLIENSDLTARWRSLFLPFAVHSPDIIRIPLGAFFVCLWAKGGIILTPELQTSHDFVSWFQLFLAACTISWRTTWIAGVGIFLLYGFAIYHYGLFHLLDYPLFIGIGVYLVANSLKIEMLRRYDLSILYVSMAVTLLWASVEKWAFSVWTIPLLEQLKTLTLGLNSETFMILAGFVEFVAAFLLLFGRESQRLAAAFLLVMFTAAIFEFGKIDAIGHSMIIAALTVAIINGNTNVNRFLQSRIPIVPLGSFELTISYSSCLVLFFILYYSSHGLIYNSWS